MAEGGGWTERLCEIGAYSTAVEREVLAERRLALPKTGSNMNMPDAYLAKSRFLRDMEEDAEQAALAQRVAQLGTYTPAVAAADAWEDPPHYRTNTVVPLASVAPVSATDPVEAPATGADAQRGATSGAKEKQENTTKE